jgi:hypothetical protein
VASKRVVEPFQLDQRVPAVVLGDARKHPLDANLEGVEDLTEVHSGEPAAHVGVLGEHQPDRQPVPGRGGDEAGEPARA